MTLLRGVIFDLDGTLVDSQLDFDQMRREMDLPGGEPILETLARLDPEHADRCREILHRHELAGAERAVPLPGALQLIEELASRGVRIGIITRNSREMAQRMLAHFPQPFEPVITRDEGPAKPDPWSIHHICDDWNLTPAETAMVGDYRFDIEAGQRAGCRTVLVAEPRRVATWIDEVPPDLHIATLLQSAELLAWCSDFER